MQVDKKTDKPMTTINPTKEYTLSELVKIEAIPGLRSYPSYKNRVLEDLAKGRNSVLKAKIIGEGRGRTIRIVGQNLINYVKSTNEENHKNDSEAEQGN